MLSLVVDCISRWRCPVEDLVKHVSSLTSRWRCLSLPRGGLLVLDSYSLPVPQRRFAVAHAVGELYPLLLSR